MGQLLLFHLSLPFPFVAFTGSPELLWSLLLPCSSSQMKGQLHSRSLINYFSVIPPLFKHQGSELAQLECTHILSTVWVINQLLTLWYTCKWQIKWALCLGWRLGSFSEHLNPKSKDYLSREEWKPHGNASHKWPRRAKCTLFKKLTSLGASRCSYMGWGSRQHSKGK